MIPDRLGVIGLGAMGGSLAWQAVRSGVTTVVGYSWDRGDGVAAAKSGAITELATTAKRVVTGADLLVLAGPPTVNLAMLETLAPVVRDRGVYVTDLTSVKHRFVQRALELELDALCAGSHPLCGTHRSGFGAATPALYENAVVYVSPVHQDSPATRKIADFWEQVMHAIPVVMEAAVHDEMLAWTSHLPQVVSSALAVTLSRGVASGVAYGPGARDTTRIAASHVQMWTEVLQLNRDAVLEALSGFEHVIAGMREAVASGDPSRLRALLEAGRNFRRSLDP